MEKTPCINCGCLYDPNELKCSHCGREYLYKFGKESMKLNGKIEDEHLLLKLELEVKGLIEKTPWEQTEYTVPGSLEKVIEAQSGLIYALKRIQKGIEFIRKGKQNENQKEDQ